MKRALFIDRDGTILQEPEDEQVDSLSKFHFVPGVITALAYLRKHTDYEFVMVSNQDGLGTPAFPTEDFLPPHELMLGTLEGEGVTFDNILIDKTFPQDNAPTRKPGTAMLTDYLQGDYDLTQSYVIGDRETDRQLAQNLGCQALILGPQLTWNDLLARIALPARTATVHRQTSETDVLVSINLDGDGASDISTGLHFFDHMLQQIPRHAGINLTIKAKGDLEVDEHHTMEDVAITLGQALREALTDKRGIGRYGFTLPMDDAVATVAIDLGGRPWLRWETQFEREYVGDTPTEMFLHFFKSLSDNALINLYVQADAQNEHHKIEAIFKGFARALKMAIRRDPEHMQLPSSKGAL